MFNYGTTGLKSPCVRDCPDRVPGECVKVCKKLKEYEAAKRAAYDRKNAEVATDAGLRRLERKRGQE